MGAVSTIRSAANPALKRVRAALAGREPGLAVLEGDRLIADARAAGLAFELLLLADDRDPAELAPLEARPVERGLLQGVSRLRTSPGSLALVRAPRPRPLSDLELGGEPLLAVAAGIADPGNLGALARTAEAAGSGALVVVGGGCSPWNEKALRGSMGSLLRLPVCLAPAAAPAAAELARRGFRQVRAATRGGVPLERFDWSGSVALWLASETGALPPEAAGLEGVSIPMAGAAESLNVGAAAAVLLFAAGRNRERA